MKEKREKEERRQRGLCHKHDEKKSRGGRASSPPTAKNSLNLLSRVNELVERI